VTSTIWQARLPGAPQAHRRRARRGRAVQVNPIKPILKAPKTKRLKRKEYELLSNLAFKFNLRRYTPDLTATGALAAVLEMLSSAEDNITVAHALSLLGNCTLETKTKAALRAYGEGGGAGGGAGAGGGGGGGGAGGTVPGLGGAG